MELNAIERNARRNADVLAAQGYPAHDGFGYPVAYFGETERGDVQTFCAECARQADAEPPVTMADVNWEDVDLYCEGCGDRIPSAYADDRIRIIQGNWGAYIIERVDGAASYLIQTDYDFPGVASTFGWSPECDCGATDGTVDCDCADAVDHIASARAWLDRAARDGMTVDDPGYLT